MAEFAVPVVDITPYVAGGTAEQRKQVATALDEAARTVGFLQILGHGVPPEAIAGLQAAIDDFFGLPLDTKKQYTAPPGVNRGYTAPKSERLSLSLGVEKAERMNDFFEAFNVGATAADYDTPGLDPVAYAPNLWPQGAGAFEQRVTAWTAEVSAVGRVLLRIFADALALEPDFFAPYTDHSLNVLRMNNYALPEGERVELDGDLIGMGEHTDFGIVTLLWADDERGLQVLDQQGVWHDVSPLPGALLINFGDLTTRWTNERWRSTLHRVKPPVVDGSIRRRRSAAYFFDGNVDAVISAIPGTVAPGEAPLYPPITVGEHIAAKLRGSRGLVNNEQGTQRESTRVLTADRA